MAISLGIYPTFSDKPISCFGILQRLVRFHHVSPLSSSLRQSNLRGRAACTLGDGVLSRLRMLRPKVLPSGEQTFCHGKSPFLMGKSTISMAIFNCYVSSPKVVHGVTSGCVNMSKLSDAERRLFRATEDKTWHGLTAPLPERICAACLTWTLEKRKRSKQCVVERIWDIRWHMDWWCH